MKRPYLVMTLMAASIIVGFGLLSTKSNTAQAQNKAIDHSRFDRILLLTVKEGLVDYPKIKNELKDDLKAYLKALSQVEVGEYGRHERIAYYTNLYNATVLLEVAQRYRSGYSVSEKGYGIFKEKLVHLKGKKISLDELEKGILMPTYKEPRLHVALVCGAYSCPPLLNRAYKGATLEADLNKQTKAFLLDTKRNMIDHKKRRLKLSKIFDWYKGDFKPDTVSYLNKYVDQDIRRYAVSYLEYDWSVNLAK